MSQKEISVESVINRAIKGDETALRHLLDKYKAFAFTIAIRIVKNREDAEEIVQDSFLKAFRALRSYKRSGKFSTWLYKIVYHTALTSIRGNKIIIDHIDQYCDDQLPMSENYSDGLIKLNNEDQKRYLKMAISQLKDTDKLMITLFYTVELSIIEVAEITDRNPSTVKVIIHRARQKLNVILTDLLKNETNNLL